MKMLRQEASNALGLATDFRVWDMTRFSETRTILSGPPQWSFIVLCKSSGDSESIRPSMIGLVPSDLFVPHVLSGRDFS